MAAEKTEKPTSKRIKDARKKGQVARSRELGQALSLGGIVLACAWFGGGLVYRMQALMAEGITRAGHRALQPLVPEEIGTLVTSSAMALGAIVAPLALTAAVVTIAAHVAQSGVVIAGEALKFNWSRLSPANGMKRLGPSIGGTELLRMALAVGVLGALVWFALDAHLTTAPALARLTPADAAAVSWLDARRLLTNTAIAMVALGGVDYAVQRGRLMSQLKMTKQEIKDEHRLMEGDPQVKSRVRRVQREMMRARMLAATKTATLVVTNPTHYAVALEYRRASMAAPVVVAKGRGVLAQRIKQIARESGVPMVENVPLARALYGSVDVGQTIPGALFEAVAEVLAYLIRIRRLVL
jgi:flagellar biosynthetic protein FlhB